MPLLPTGHLSTSGSQIVDEAGTPIRICAVGWNQGFGDIPGTVKAMVAAGFNACRLSYVNANLAVDLARIDEIVAAAQAVGLKVIIDHHTCEMGSAADGWGAQQKNGLPYDVGGITDGSNGAGVKGTVSLDKFVADWIAVAAHFKGNSTVIGYDLHNEPLSYPNMSTWGDGNPDSDLVLIYQRTGNAIHAVDPGPLIICEGPQNYDMGFPWGDLSRAAQHPVVLDHPNKAVYSIHDYPQEVSGIQQDSGDDKIADMNHCWGFLVTDNIAPVWIGEMGSSMQAPSDAAWAKTLTDYMLGLCGDKGGPTFSGNQQPVSGCWWAWGNLDGQMPDGTLDGRGNLRPQQQAVWSKLLPIEYDKPAAATQIAVPTVPTVPSPPPIPTPPPTLGAGIWKDGSIPSMAYKLLLPEGYTASRTYPVLLYLHALGMGTDPASLLTEINPWFNTAAFRRSHPAIIVVPLLDQATDPTGQTTNWGGFGSVDTTGEQGAIAVLQQVLSTYACDHSRIYVTGFGMGGIGAWDAIIKHNAYTGTESKTFAAALILAGAEYGQGYPTPNPAVIAALKDVPIWAIHGAQDTQVPLIWDRSVYAAIKAAGGRMKYTEDAYLGANVWDTYLTMTGSDEPFDWTFSQTFEAEPPPVPMPPPVPVPPIPTPPTPPVTASPNDTVVSAAGGQIVDLNGNIWTLHAGQVVVNGTADTSAHDVVMLAFVSGHVWKGNSGSLWWSKVMPSDAWSPSAGTRTNPLTIGIKPSLTFVGATTNRSTIISGSDVDIVNPDGTVIQITSGDVATVKLGRGSIRLSAIGMASLSLHGGTGTCGVTVDGGRNVIKAGKGALEVVGGSHGDAYHYSTGDGLLTIGNFNPAAGDTLSVTGSLQSSMQVASDGAGGTRLSFSGKSAGVVLRLLPLANPPKIVWT
jgi:endoglucanase